MGVYFIMASMADVARLAGVSPALVSRYVNGKTGVGVDNRDKIAEAISTLGYRRNEIARSLARKKTDAIGVVIDFLCQNFFHELVKGLEAGGQQAGYKLILCDCMNDAELKRSYIDYLSHNRVDGLVMYGSLYTDNQIVAQLASSSFPFILIENDVPGVSADKVLVDSRGGIEQMVCRLYDKGCKDIRMVCWMLNTFAGQERLEGYRSGMSKCGLPVNESSIYRTNTKDMTKLAMREVVESGNLPDALIFGADELAFAAIEVFEKHGIQIPGNMAITGFDHDYYISRDRLMPRLTTLEQPLFEMGKTAVKMLAERIAEPKIPARSMNYSVKLIEGVSG